MIVNGFCKDVFRALSTECAIDAPRDVADGVNALKSPERATILATHSLRLLDSIVPDRVHVPSSGRIATSGGRSWRWSSNREAVSGCGRRPAHERRGGIDGDDPVRQRLRPARSDAARPRFGGAVEGGGWRMSGMAASTATVRYADAFARRDAALPGHDSAGPWKAAAGA